jgi:hypothetical protein
MDFIDQLRAIGTQVARMKETVQTEEATKQAFVLPFLNALGYNVFDPTEVVPEMCADVGVKKGEKVDYAIMKDGKPIILIEAKHWGVNLNNITPTQLYRYFSVTQARIGILTNGVIYRFFSDLEESNKMDHKPFLEFNILDISEPMVAEVKRITKSSFQIEDVLNSAIELKYTKEIKRILSEELASPTEEFVKFFTSRVHTGRMTPSVKQHFTDLVKRALNLFISERLSERLKTALAQESGESAIIYVDTLQESGAAHTGDPATESKGREERITTTPEEMEAFYLVKSILRSTIDPSRIHHRDAISYFSILLDNNNRKTICRLYLDGAKRYIGFMGDGKKEEKIQIQDLNDLYQHSDRIQGVVARLGQRPISEPGDNPAGDLVESANAS